MSGCCSERGCTRSQPFEIMRGGFGRYYLVTAYYEDGPHLGKVRRRHDITEQVEALLAREREAKT